MKTRSMKHLVDHDEGDEDRPTTPKLQLPRRNEVVSSPQVEIVVAYLHYLHFSFRFRTTLVND